MLTRQQKRAQQRAQTKAKVVSTATRTLLAIYETLPAWAATPRVPQSVPAIAIDCTPDNRPDCTMAEAGVGAGVAKENITKVKHPTKTTTPRAERAVSKLDQPEHTKPCNLCGQQHKHTLYRTDPNGLCGLADTCRLCEAVLAFVTGDLSAQLDQTVLAQKQLREQLDRQHQREDETKANPKDKPIREDRAEASGWPTNQFTTTPESHRERVRESHMESQKKARDYGRILSMT